MARLGLKWMHAHFCAAEALLNVSGAVQIRMRVTPNSRTWTSFVSDACLLAKDKDTAGDKMRKGQRCLPLAACKGSWSTDVAMLGL